MSSANGSSSFAKPLYSSSAQREREALAEQQRILEQFEQQRQQQQQQSKRGENHSGRPQQTHTSSDLQIQSSQYPLEDGFDTAGIELGSYPRKLAAVSASTTPTSADSVVTESATSATLLDDEWSLNLSLSGFSASTRGTTADEKLRREQQKQLEVYNRLKEQQDDLVRKASNSATSSMRRSSASAPSATTRQRASFAALKTEEQDAEFAADGGDDQSTGSCSSNNFDHSRRDSRIRSRQDIEVEMEQLELYRWYEQQHQELKHVHQHKHGYSLPDILNHPSGDEEDVELGMTHAHSADLEDIISSQRQMEEYLHHQSLSDITHRSPSDTDVDPTSPSSNTRPSHASMPAASMSALLSQLHDEDTDGIGNSPRQQRRERRHQSREEWEQKRAALPPTNSTNRSDTASIATAAAAGSSHPRALSAPQSPSERQEWNDAEAKRQMQSPQVVEALQAEQQRSAAQHPRQQQHPPNNDGQSHNDTGIDSGNFVIEKVPQFNSSRMMRKTSSGFGNNSTREMDMEGPTCGDGGGGDYNVEGHDYVGAFYVTTVDGSGEVQDPTGGEGSFANGAFDVRLGSRAELGLGSGKPAAA